MIRSGASTAVSRQALSRIRPLLHARGTLGLGRRGPGDLHLGNIALIDGRPVPFDALEFDPVVASGDVLYDLAFLLMDLGDRKLQPAANVVLNRYLTESRRTEDLDALAALPFLISMRAAMRRVYGTKVTRLTLGGLSSCPRQRVCYRRCEAPGRDSRSQRTP